MKKLWEWVSNRTHHMQESRRGFGRERIGHPFDCAPKSYSSQKSPPRLWSQINVIYIFLLFLIWSIFFKCWHCVSQISWNKLSPHNRYDFATVVCSNVPTSTVILVEEGANKECLLILALKKRKKALFIVSIQAYFSNSEY